MRGGILYYTVVTLHVSAAMFWLGGMFFLAIVGAPALRAIEPPLRAKLFQALGSRFRTAGWIAISVLLVTGTLNLWFRGWLHASVLCNPAFYRTSTGQALAVKLAAVTTMLVLSAIHDFILGPRSGKVEPGSAEAYRLRRLASLTARVEAMAGLVLLVAAVRLAR